MGQWGGPLVLIGLVDRCTWACARVARSDPGCYGARRWRWGAGGRLKAGLMAGKMQVVAWRENAGGEAEVGLWRQAVTTPMGG